MHSWQKPTVGFLLLFEHSTSKFITKGMQKSLTQPKYSQVIRGSKNYTNKRNVKNSKHNRFRSVSGSFSLNVTFAVLPEPTSNRRTAERKTAVGAPTDRTTAALDVSSLHSNRPALRKRVLRTRSRNTIDRY